MTESDWGEQEILPDGKKLKFNTKTKRWYLYNKRGVLVTSNRKKSVLENWREGE
jgi:hypothetical protein